GVTGGSLDRESAAYDQFALHIAAPRHGGTEVVGELKAAAAHVNVLLNAVPLDVIEAGGDPQAIGDGVLRSDFVALGGVRFVVQRRLTAGIAFGHEIGLANAGQRRVHASWPEAFGVSRIIEIL